MKLDDPQPGHLFECFNLLHLAMLADQGVGLAPSAILADDLKSSRRIRLFETEVLLEKAYYISEPATPRLSQMAEIKIFKDWLLEEVTID